MPHEVTYVVGLDLGQAQDYTALAVLERSRWVPESLVSYGVMGRVETIPAGPTSFFPTASERRYAVRHLERFPLGTSYPAIVDRVVALFAQAPLTGSTLAVDQTGVGRAVVDLLRKARPRCTLRPITITAGNAVVADGAGWHVPKKELVGNLQVLLQSRRLQVAKGLPDAAVLIQELEAFRVKITASIHEVYEAWRERDKDDLVLALAMAAWVGERGMQELWVL
jgi:hypothetical protein